MATLQEGVAYPDENGVMLRRFRSRPIIKAAAIPIPITRGKGGRVQYNGGAIDGFLLAGMSDEYAIGYYTEVDRPFFSALARSFTTCDWFFSTVMGPTYPNRIFQHAAQTDRIENTRQTSMVPTIWDRLAQAGVSARYDYSDVSFLWLWGIKYLPIHARYERFLIDAANGTLPSVSFVEPRFGEDRTGTSGSDHPHGDIREGDAFLAETFHAVASGPAWPRTVFIVTYDEWGGFFDHVAPPRAIAPNGVDPDVVKGRALLGMRVPVIVASPWTRGDSATQVVSTVFDHTSVLKLGPAPIDEARCVTRRRQSRQGAELRRPGHLRATAAAADAARDRAVLADAAGRRPRRVIRLAAAEPRACRERRAGVRDTSGSCPR
ncbi:MAG: alkaline phosphatase family protein [Candidatus Binatia bacterium]